MVFQFQNTVMLVIGLVLFLGMVWAFVDALTRRADAFEAADKLTKKGWLLILAIGLGVMLFFGTIGLFAGAVIMLVYHLDVRPAVAAMTRRR
jgi:hypothetical protein